jgi:hypothetical protein
MKKSGRRFRGSGGAAQFVVGERRAWGKNCLLVDGCLQLVCAQRDRRCDAAFITGRAGIGGTGRGRLRGRGSPYTNFGGQQRAAGNHFKIPGSFCARLVIGTAAVSAANTARWNRI